MQLQAEKFLRLAAPSYRSLHEGAQQCLMAVRLHKKHLSLLQNLLGPTEELAQHATMHDLTLMMKVQRKLLDQLQVGTHRYPHPSALSA